MNTIIWTPLNITGYNNILECDPIWLSKRCDILNKYVIPSLEYQTDQNFIWFLEIAMGTEHLIVPNLKLDKVPVAVISKPLRGFKDSEINDSRGAVKQSMEIDKQNILKHINSEIFYFVRLNSDDMYRKTFVEELRKMQINEQTQAIIPTLGYHWYLKEDAVVLRGHNSPPFFAFVYNRKNYLEGFRYHPRKGHVGVKALPHIKMDKQQMWCWIIHDVNQKIIRKGGYPSYTNYTQVDKSVLNNFLPKGSF